MVCLRPVRLTSYVDDFCATTASVRAVLLTAIELVYEATAVGLSLNIRKCRLAPSTRIIFLGMVVDTVDSYFSLPRKRALRLSTQATDLAAATRRHHLVHARQIAQFLGLLWAASPCCPRGVAIMCRGLIDILATEMCRSVYDPALAFPPYGKRGNNRNSSVLRRVLATFWDGVVSWSDDAEADLAF